MRIEFGLALDFGTERAPLGQVLDEFVPLLELAERKGFTSVVAGQSFPAQGGAFHLPSPLIVLSALAPRTKLKLGTGVTLMPGWGALNLAYDGAVLDQVSDGRLFLGIAVANPHDWQRFDIPKEQAGKRFDELLQAAKALWRGERGFRGDLIDVRQSIWPLPIQPGGPPLLIGGLTQHAARRAARYADGYYSATQYHLPDVARQVQRYREALAEEGKPAESPRVAINRLLVLADSEQQALSEGGPYLRGVLAKYAWGGALTIDGQRVDPADPNIVDRVREDVILVGSPESVLTQIQAYVAAGVNQFQMRVAPHDMPADLVARTITLAGEQILPKLASLR